MRTALFLVDARRPVATGTAPTTPVVRRNLTALVDRARADGWVVVIVQKEEVPAVPAGPRADGWERVLAPRDGELLVRTPVPDPFTVRPDLAAYLRERGVTQTVVAGLQSDEGLRGTCDSALRAGFDVILAGGAHATYGAGEDAERLAREVEAEVGEHGVNVVPVGDLANV
ncbi:isochorismatase family protein [Georgenia daeguensis]|uniref:Isochorismatase-like domain-containing protein n=1 Tax=Georgenia daeguensis TaxID=908355 RepID=A0ABP6ULF2_9MICO